MLQFIIKRILYMIPTLLLISIITFAIIQLPPGDWLTTYVMTLEAEGVPVSPEQIEILRTRYGMNQPFHVKYFNWMKGIVLEGDLGYSFEWNKSVNELIWSRIALTFVVALCSMLFTWIVAFIIGVYSSLRPYSIGDYIATFVGFIGLATPSFMLALILMWVSLEVFGVNYTGLFSPEFVGVPWSFAKVADMAKHLPIPIIVVGTSGTAGLIRILRANLRDELGKPYVTTARARGLAYTKIVLKYPLRIALIPFVSTAGWQLANLVSGEMIVSTVLSLPTTGPLLLSALKSQDMFLAGSFIMIISALTVVGTVVSDIALAALDPRIRYE